jgi:type IV pilus assembly protein PilC
MASNITAGDTALFTRDLATLMKADVGLVQSLEVVADRTDGPMKDLVLKVRDDVSAGSSFTTAIRAHPDQFDELFCKLVQAGEQADALTTILERIASYKEKTQALKVRIKKALNFPIAALVVIAGILLASAPLVGIATVALVGVLYLAYKGAYSRSQKVRDAQQGIAMRLPILNDLLDKSCIARFSRTLSTTFRAGVPLIDALDYASSAAGSAVYSNAIVKIKEDVSKGNQLNYAMKQTEVFPDQVIRMVAIGEKVGSLDVMFGNAANYYEQMVDDQVERLIGPMHPIFMSFLGAVVGGLIVATFLTL